MLELVDEADSKSVGLITRAGSTPATGTIFAPKCYASEHFFTAQKHNIEHFLETPEELHLQTRPYFDSSVQFQLSFVNLSASQETFARSISIPPCGDEFDGIRAEYAGMLQNQLARGNNGLIKTKYLTFGVEADNLRAAKPRLERIETDLLNNFKRLGVVAAPLNGFPSSYCPASRARRSRR